MELIQFLLSECADIVVCPNKHDLYEEAILRQEACIGSDGQLCVATGEFTGRASDDKYIVTSEGLSPTVEFGGAGRALSPEMFKTLTSRAQAYLNGKRVYVIDFIAGSIKGRVITELAWQGLFASNLLRTVSEPHESVDLTILAVPGCTSGGESVGFRSNVAIACDFANGVVVIAGTAYAGEIKKSVFSYASYVLPEAGVLPMHSSVTTNVAGLGGAVFFGLSGTGKTSLSADPSRLLLGDDEHAWTDEGIYNIEGGCYAKVINLSYAKEPGIWTACHQFMTVLENVGMTESRVLDFSSNRLTENTRAAYPLFQIEQSHVPGVTVEHPKNIIMLTCDAYGVLPSVAKLSKEAAIYHFLSGYTAKIAGTEAGVKEPKATFSRCFGAPFMPHNAQVYAELLDAKLTEHNPDVWLVNTGWVEGPYGVGHRIDIDVTREIIDNILNGELAKHKMFHDDVLNLDIPEDVAFNRPTWKDTDAYQVAKEALAKMFAKNALEMIDHGSELLFSVVQAGPQTKK